jgi:aminoglycoside 6'-N-acetyltransferase
VSSILRPEIAFRRLEEVDFPLLAAWLAEPHVHRFYQKRPIALEEVAREYESPARGQEPTICSLAEIGGAPFAYLQCYRNADYPEWADLIGAADGISAALFIGDPACLHRGLGQAALSEYLGQVAFAAYPGERCVYIAHEGATPPRFDDRNRSAFAGCACSRKMAWRWCCSGWTGRERRRRRSDAMPP